MERVFERVFARAQPLGNPARKYLRTVERNGARLLECLERSGRLGRTHIDRTAPSLANDFDHVVAAGSDPKEKLLLLGTFYAVQFLHLNARSLERLAVDLAEQPGRRLSYTRFLTRTADDFFTLSSTYVHRVLRILHPALRRVPYVLCAVGTRSHQDDVDVAVIDKAGEARQALDRTFSALANQMLRYASPLDNYVAEKLGAKGFCLSTDELNRALRSRQLNFVVVTELLWADRMSGSQRLFRTFREEVTSGFYHRAGEDNTRHELYLRGLLGESRSLLLRPPRPGSIHPKDEGLRLIRSLTTALKTVTGLESSCPREILQVLQKRKRGLREGLRQLQESLVFLETFYLLNQLLISQDEEIEVEGESARDNLRQVASAMGYRDRGSLQSVDHLLVHYHEAVSAAHSAAIPIMEEVARHLAGTSRFARWTRGSFAEEDGADLAREFAAGVRVFRRARFWDDVLEALASTDGRLLQTFAASFARLPAARRARLAAQYADWGCTAPFSLLTLLTLLAGRGHAVSDADPAPEITRQFLRKLGTRVEDIRSVARVFRYNPDLINRFLLTLDTDGLERFRASLRVAIGDSEVATARDRLDALARLHVETSRYVKRVLARLTVRYPATVLALHSDAAITTLAHGRLAASERHTKLEVRKALLGDYYDMEFLRIATGTLRGESSARTRSEFAEMTRIYLSGLLDICLREAERTAGSRMFDRDSLGIYLTGGHARGRPYDEDYDLVVLIDSDDPEEIRIAERATVLINRQIAQRGVIAQYRFGERTRRYVTTMNELVELMEGDDDDVFVDRCQVLGSRLIAGGRRVEEALVRRVLRPHVLEKQGEFIARLRQELHDRRADDHASPSGMLHLKEIPGGFRDIDLSLMAALARFGIRMKHGEESFRVLIRLDPSRAECYETLRLASKFLVALRSAYRVSVVASDLVEKEFLDAPARILGYAEAPGVSRRERLFSDILRHTRRASEAVEQLTQVGGLALT